MNRLVSLLAILLLGASLGGCAGELAKIQTTVSNAIGTVGGVRVKSKTAYVAINVFNAAEKSVTAYLNLPACNGAIAVCRIYGAADALDKPFSAAIAARNDLLAWLKANPGSLADAGLYKALVSATSSLQKIMAIYNIETTGGSK